MRKLDIEIMKRKANAHNDEIRRVIADYCFKKMLADQEFHTEIGNMLVDAGMPYEAQALARECESMGYKASVNLLAYTVSVSEPPVLPQYIKVRDLFRNPMFEDFDMDMYNDYDDGDYPAYCFCHLTEEGEKEFKSVLGLEVKIIKDPIGTGRGGLVLIDQFDSDTCEKLSAELGRLFWACAGYCSCSDYDKWFTE